MPNSVITNAGLALLARAQAEGFAVPIDRMIFADVPGIDPEQTPDPAAGMPAAGTIVSNALIDHAGKINENEVVYSRILSATDGPFYLNWIGLYSSAYETLIAVAVVHRHYKHASDGFQAGATLYKHFDIQYANAAALTGINIDAAAWQLNFDARYEPLGAVNAHNNAAAPHPGKFEAAGAVSSHVQATDPHPQYKTTAARYPDWGNAVDLSAGTDYTAATAGWLLVGLTKDGDGRIDCYMTINNQSVLVGRPGTYHTCSQPAMYIPIKAGDVYRYNNIGGVILSFYKFIPGRV